MLPPRLLERTGDSGPRGPMWRYAVHLRESKLGLTLSSPALLKLEVRLHALV